MGDGGPALRRAPQRRAPRSFHTAVCDRLGIRCPILQGAMQGAGGPALAAAVSEAGGLGVLPTFGGTEEQLRRDIEETRKRTDRPFGVNITPMGPAFTESRARIVIELGVPVVTTGRGDPGARIVERLKQAGVVVAPVVPSVAHARRVEAEGADLIVASGSEAGGHVGSVSTLPLVPQVVDAVHVPVVAAGGVSRCAAPAWNPQARNDLRLDEIAPDSPSDDFQIHDAYYDHRDADRDLNCLFPIDRLRELASEGVVGGVASRLWSGFMGRIYRRSVVVGEAAPVLARELEKDGVDVFLLVPA